VRSTNDVMQLFRKLNDERGITIMLVTHEPDVAAFAKRTVTFRDGHILSDTSAPAEREMAIS
jgi:putative ABC transport system ATP-binding protein